MPEYGAGSQEALDFHLMVYHLATQIPYGRVTNYGHLAYLAGKPENSRQVGYALKHLPSRLDLRYNTETVPWWRIIGGSGYISMIEKRQHQLERLRQEIAVTDKGGVDLAKHGWFPEIEELNTDVVYPE